MVQTPIVQISERRVSKLPASESSPKAPMSKSSLATWDSGWELALGHHHRQRHVLLRARFVITEQTIVNANTQNTSKPRPTWSMGSLRYRKAFHIFVIFTQPNTGSSKFLQHGQCVTLIHATVQVNLAKNMTILAKPHKQRDQANFCGKHCETGGGDAFPCS